MFKNREYKASTVCLRQNCNTCFNTDSTGRECKATHHCVSRVWSKMTFPEDNDSICKICTDMVQQARDQLQSNETQVITNVFCSPNIVIFLEMHLPIVSKNIPHILRLCDNRTIFLIATIS